MAVSGQISATFAVNDERTVALSKRNVGPNVATTITVTDGTGAAQGNKTYAVERTLPGASEDLDLNGILTDALGAILNISRIVGIKIVNLSTTAPLVIGGAASNAWATLLNATGTLTIRPSTANNKSFVMVGAADAIAYAVTSGTGDILKVSGTAGEKYQILFLGS